MQNIVAFEKVGNYNLDKALYLLGPKNHGSFTPRGLLDHIDLIIQNLVKVFFRTINFIFGDHQWYNNKTAHDIVTQYYKTPVGSPEILGKIYCINDQLKFRGELRTEGCSTSNRSIASEPTLLSAQNAFFSNESAHMSRSEANQNVSLPHNLHSPQNSNSSRGFKACGNISMRNVSDGLHKPKKEVSRPIPDEAFTNLITFLAPRRGPVNKLSIDSDYNGKYAQAYDPHELFALAALDAANELNIPQRELQNPNFVKSGKWLSICRLAVFNLLLQAKLSAGEDDCEGPCIRLNENIFMKTRYQKPTIVYLKSNEENTYEPLATFATDIFSSTYVGCDPDGAKRLMHTLQQKGLLENFKNKFQQTNSKNLFLRESDEAILFDLLNTMAEQVQNRYSAKMMPMLTAFSKSEKLLADKSFAGFEIPEGKAFEECVPYDEYVNNAQTSYQLFLLTFTWCTQKLASAGLINENDIYSGGDELDAIARVVCSEALLRILSKATIIDEFNLRLSKTITLPCGRFFSHESLPEEPNVLHKVEHFIQNELSGKKTDNDPSSDLIKITSMFAALTHKEKTLFFSFYSENYKRTLYALKGIPEEQMLDIKQTKTDFESLSNERKKAFRDLVDELSGLFKILHNKYFNHMGGPIYDRVEISEDALPSILRPPRVIDSDSQIEKKMELDYLEENYRDLVVLDKRPLCNKPPKVLINSWRDVRGYFNHEIERREAGIFKQHRKIANVAKPGNCMYGALARVIFGTNVNEGYYNNYGSYTSNNVNNFCLVLRKAAAKYMLDHKDEYEASMYNEHYDKKGPYETDEQFTERMKTAHANRLVQHCKNIVTSYEEGTDREMGAIATIFGVEVQTFNTQGQLEIRDGIIQPNARVGNNFIGKQPIQLIYSGSHFNPLETITD